MAHGLTSSSAREFLAQLPAINELMPLLEVDQVATMLKARQLRMMAAVVIATGLI